MPRPKLTVLIIDDDDAALQYLEELLTDQGFATVSTARRLDNIAGLRETPPDLIVLDLMLSGEDPVQLLSQLAAVRLPSALLVVGELPDRLMLAAADIARQTGLRVLGRLRKPIWSHDLQELVAELLQAARAEPVIERDNFFRLLKSGALTNRYQPVVDASRAAVHRVTASACLESAGHSEDVSGDDLWSTALAYDCADKIYSSLLKSVIGDIARFAKLGSPVTVCCPIPGRLLANKKLAQGLLKACSDVGLLPSSLCLQVTERDLRQYGLAALRSVTRLGLRGVQLAIEVSDTGTVTRGVLDGLPASELVINDELIGATIGDSSARGRVMEIVEYAREHEVEAIATGVGTAEHLGLLLDLGLSYFQGGVFTEPRAFEEMRYWIKGLDLHLSQLGIVSRLRTTGQQPAVR